MEKGREVSIEVSRSWGITVLRGQEDRDDQQGRARTNSQ